MTLLQAATGERINRFLARRGIASRRSSDVLVLSGRVTVNGATVRPGHLVDPGNDVIAFDGRLLARDAPGRRTVVLNKPPGVVSTRSDPQGRTTVLDFVDDSDGLVPVGRLDADSRGLILLSSDGDLAFRLTHPSQGIAKVYRVQIGIPVNAALARRLAQGVVLPDGPARPLAVEVAGPDQLDVAMGEGRKREVRRMVMALGLDVVDLQRIAFGPVHLDDLPEGRWRPLTDGEARVLGTSAGLASP